MKGVPASQLSGDLGCRIMLSNTYHLGLRPGQELLDQVGGLHKLMAWDKSVLTDSGGFQMVSLLALADITEVANETTHAFFRRRSAYFIYFHLNQCPRPCLFSSLMINTILFALDSQ